MKAINRLQLLILACLLLPAVTAAADDDTFEVGLTVPAGTMLDVDTGSGSIEISAGPGRDVTVIGTVQVNRSSFWRRAADKEEILAAVLANPPVELEGNRLAVGHIEDRSIRKRVSISYVIVVPADTSIKADTGSGSILVTGLAAPVDVDSGSGSLTLRNIAGPVKADAGSGRIRAEQIAGEFDGDTGSGSIYLSQAAPGDVRASTGSGSIELAGIDGALEASAGSGSITVDGTQQGDWKLDTGSGSITVQLPDDAAFYLDAESRSGGITVDHPVTVQGKISRRHVRGEVRGGGPQLSVDTGSGSIRIK